MAQTVMTGFEGALSPFTHVDAAIDVSYKHSGSYGVQMTAGTGTMTLTGMTHPDTRISFWMNPRTGTGEAIRIALSQDTMDYGVKIFPTYVQAYYEASTSNSATVDTFSYNTWNYVTIRAYRVPTGVRLYCIINNVLVHTASFTTSSTSPAWTTGLVLSTPGSTNVWIDDIVVASWAYYSPYYGMINSMEALTLNRDGTTTGWTASTGSFYECVNEVPYSDTDYITGATGANRVNLGFLEYSLTNKTFIGLGITLRAKANTTPTQIAVGISDGTNRRLVGVRALTTGYTTYHFALGANDLFVSRLKVTDFSNLYVYIENYTQANTITVSQVTTEVLTQVSLAKTKSSGFDVSMSIAGQTGAGDFAYLKVLATFESYTNLIFELDASGGYWQCIAKTEDVIRTKWTTAISSSTAIDVRFVSFDEYVAFYANGVLQFVFVFPDIVYASETTVYIYASPDVTNVVRRELTDWRRAVYLDLQNSGGSTIQSIIQSRPIEIYATLNQIEYSYDAVRATVTPAYITRHSEQHAINGIGSDAIVYGVDVSVQQNTTYLARNGFKTSLLSLGDLDSGADKAAKKMLQVSTEKDIYHEIVIVPDFQIEPGDKVAISYTNEVTGEVVAVNIIVDAVRLRMSAGPESKFSYEMIVGGRETT